MTDKIMRVFDVGIYSDTHNKRTDLCIDAEDFHEACVTALSTARAEEGRVLYIIEVRQPPLLVA